MLFSANAFAAEKEPVKYKAYSWAETEMLSAIIESESYFEITPETACDITVHGGQLNLRHDEYGLAINAGSGSFSQYYGVIEKAALEKCH